MTYTPLHHINLTQNKDKKSSNCRGHVEGRERRCHVEKHLIYPVTTSNCYQITACTRVQYWASYQQSTVVVSGSSSI